MLIQFSVENFKSIRDRMTLSMVAASRLHDDPELDEKNVVRASAKLNLLKVAGIYGANASGKSNLVEAFNRFRYFVHNSTDLEDRPWAEPFLLSDGRDRQPTVFEVLFILDGQQWRYGFAVRGEEVVEEWLFVARSARETLIFEREGARVVRGTSFRRGGALLNPDGDIQRPEALFLSLLAEIGVPEGVKVAGYILEHCATINGISDTDILPFSSDCIRSGQYATWMQEMYAKLGLGFDEVRVESGEEADDSSESRGRTRKKSYKLETVRHPVASDGAPEEVVFPLSWESAGTQKIVALSGPLAHTLADGIAIFVDELDARLHPQLTEYLISLFQSPETNPRNAQLIFVTHDTNLLDSNRFRRDQLWFVDKDQEGASRLYSLAEFSGLRKTRNYELDYLRGRFGGLPFLLREPLRPEAVAPAGSREETDAVR